MTFRTLCGALAMLLLVAPIGATVCGACAPDGCSMAKAPEHGGHPERDEPKTERHCPSTQSEPAAVSTVEQLPVEQPPAGGTPPCHATAAVMASTDCCSVAPTPEPQQVPALVAGIAFEIALDEVTTEVAAPTAERKHSELGQRQPPAASAGPLYTLHSAFLL